MRKPKNIDQTTELFEKILTALQEIKETINKPITSNMPPEVPVATNEQPSTVQQAESSYPVPIEYRDVVDSVLNKSFQIEIEPHTDAPVTTFSIIVPEKYSKMTPAQKEVLKVDRRPKVISFADGVNGVREWAEKVFNNLGSEIQAMVVADRVQGG